MIQDIFSAFSIILCTVLSGTPSIPFPPDLFSVHIALLNDALPTPNADQIGVTSHIGTFQKTHPRHHIEPKAVPYIRPISGPRDAWTAWFNHENEESPSNDAAVTNIERNADDLERAMTAFKANNNNQDNSVDNWTYWNSPSLKTF